MSKNLLDPNNWVNPALGAMVVGAFLAPMPDVFRCDYRSCNCSARELLEQLQLGSNYFTAELSADRAWVVVTLKASTKGASVCSYGYLDNQVERLCSKGFWTRWMGQGSGVYHAPLE